MDLSVILQEYDCKLLVSSITSLNLSNNFITSVDKDIFGIFYKLVRLDLSNNYISQLDTNTFTSLRSLKELDLSYNLLTRLQAGLISIISLEKVWFNNNNISDVEHSIVGHSNIGLVYFNMNYNSLTYLDPWPFTTYQTNIRRLYREFYFQHNNISRLTNYMNWTYDLVYPFEVQLYMQYNELATISLDTLQQYDKHVQPESLFPALLTYQINATHNMFFCDCLLYDLASTIQRGLLRYTRVEEYRYRCGSPAALAGIDFLHDLHIDQLVCNVTNDCPTKCFCQDRPHNDTFLVNCTDAGLAELPEVIPQTSRSKIELILDKNNIETLQNTNYMANIYTFSIADNMIQQLDENFLKSINANRLDFRNNRIQSVPKYIKKFSYSSVFLSGNPLECECDSLWISEWMKLDSDTGDMSLTCDSKTGIHTIVDMNVKSLGCTYELLISICVCLGVVLVLLFVILIFARQCPYETRVILHTLFRIRPGRKYEVDHDDNKEVDIYIVFDHECQDVTGWVKYFLKKLNKKKPIYSILNPARFTEPGSQAVSIQKWIGKSKRIIIVLSENIFQNEWRCFEIDDAERRMLEAATRQNGQTPNEEDGVADGNNDHYVVNIEDEYLENAPKIIYVIFNNSDLLGAKFDDDKWIKRIEDKLAIRMNEPEAFDKHAKAWQEKLQQEPWKSRLAGKIVLSPDEKLFWPKLRYELPPNGNGKGDGNFTFTHVPPDNSDIQHQVDYPNNQYQRNQIRGNNRISNASSVDLSRTVQKARVHERSVNNNRKDTKGTHANTVSYSETRSTSGVQIKHNANSRMVSSTVSRNFNREPTSNGNVPDQSSQTTYRSNIITSRGSRSNSGNIEPLRGIRGSDSPKGARPKTNKESGSAHLNTGHTANTMSAVTMQLNTTRINDFTSPEIDPETNIPIYSICAGGHNPSSNIVTHVEALKFSRTMSSNTTISKQSTNSSSNS